MPKRRRLATGIYEDAFGISVVLPRRGRSAKEHRFDPGTPVDRLKKWRATQIGQAAELDPPDPRGSLARDVVRYLKRLKGLSGYKSEKSHFKAWLQIFKRKRRWEITQEMCELAIARWRQQGYAPRTIRHRCRALKSLYVKFDGPKGATPLDQIILPKKPRGRAVSVADDRINDVALELRKHEILQMLKDSKTRARFLVLATTGRRPAEVVRARREDVDLDRRLWFTRTAKDGLNTIVFLNDEMAAAWQLFIRAGAWGTYDSTSFSKTVRRCGWPKGIRPYNLRHSTGLAIRARGGDLEDVQDQLGHASIDTAREFYLHALPARQKAVSDKLAGRFMGEAFLPCPAPTKARQRDTKRPKNNLKLRVREDAAAHDRIA